VEQAVAHAARIQARRAFLTHIAHDLAHEETNARLGGRLRLCYDGLRLEVEL
jgi:phosphoribosyl 1,2-cyclic phosphate phosphodiesterase